MSWSFFDAIFCINLAKRKDKWLLAEKQFEKMCISDKVTRVNGIEHHVGVYGCKLSHTTLLRIAKEKNYKNVLIFEDDLEFCCDKETTEKHLNLSISDLPENWHMLYLGANLLRPTISVTDNISKLNGAYAMHAYAVNSSMYDTIINYSDASGQRVPIDVITSELQKNHNCFCTKKLLANQTPSRSNILGHEVDYRETISCNFKLNIK